jgi:hypothetical protein
VSLHIVTRKVKRRFVSDNFILLANIVLLIFGFVFMIDINVKYFEMPVLPPQTTQHTFFVSEQNQLALWRFFFGTFLVAINFPVGQTEVLSIFTKVLGNVSQG